MKTACIQLCNSSDIDANLRRAVALIKDAHGKGAKFIATPENTLIMTSNPKTLFAKIKGEQDTQAITLFSNLAHELGIYLLIGSMAIKRSDDKAANRSFLFGPEGKILARYDKIHLFDVDINATETWRESANYTPGQSPALAPIDGFCLGLSICYDLRFAALYKYYAKHGANILSVPAAFTAVTGKAHWQTLLRARAIETSAYVIAPAQGGVHEDGRATWGHSMIINPWGDIIAELDHDQPGFCLADLSLETIKRERARIPAWNQDTPL